MYNMCVKIDKKIPNR